MGTVVTASVPTDQFALAETFDRTPPVEIEAVPVVGQSGETVLPLIRCWTSDLDSLHPYLRRDPSTDDVEQLDTNAHSALYWVSWHPQVRDVVSLLVQSRGTLLGARAGDGHWHLRVLFPQHDAVATAYDDCQSHGIDLTVRRVREMASRGGQGRNGLSDKQFEAITTAFETGYFRIPRGITLQELAEELGVSHQALSERLRRGYRAMISNMLYDPDTSEKDETDTRSTVPELSPL